MQAPDTSLGRSFDLAQAPPAWVFVLIIAPVLIGLCYLGYRKESLSTPTRWLLAGLRCAALLVLCLVCLRPVLVERQDHVQAPEVLVLIDDSASMRRKDAYADDPARSAPLAELARLAGAPRLEDAQRIDLVRAALQNSWLPLLEERGYLANVLAFAGDLSPVGSEWKLSASGATTQIGTALERALQRSLGKHVTDIVLISDGRQTSGPLASAAARAATSAGIPVHTVVVGDTREEKNAWLELVEAPESALEGDEIALTIRAMGRGLKPQETASIVLEELQGSEDLGPDSGEPSAQTLDVQERTLVDGGERITMVARAGAGDARTRERRFRIKIPPLGGETLQDDNQIEVAVRVVPEKVRVLYVEGYPRWEYRFLKEVLKRADENIRVQCFLLSATSDFPQESTREVPALARVPTSREELLRDYDVIILGDVSPWQISPDPAQAQEFLESLVQFVESGGGLALLAGEYDNPRAYLSTPLEPVFPVVLDAGELATGAVDTTREYRPLLDDPSNPHEIVRLLSDPAENRRLWEVDGGLFPMYWFQGIARAKPASQVLLRHPSETSKSGPYPLLVAGYYPAGRTLFLAFDETWRWRFHYGDLFHERFWRNAVRWLALGRIKSGDRRFKLEVGRSEISIGESQVVEVRLLDVDFRPSTESSAQVQVSGADNKQRSIDLAQSPGRPGVYRGTFTPSSTGSVRLWIENAAERVATAEFAVVLPSLEQAEPAPDRALMAEVALLGSGRAVELARLADLNQEFPAGQERREPIFSRLDDIWDTWYTLLLALLLLSAEWIVRKRLELV